MFFFFFFFLIPRNYCCFLNKFDSYDGNGRFELWTFVLKILENIN